MNRRQLLLLNFGWAALALCAYFVGTGGDDDAELSRDGGEDVKRARVVTALKGPGDANRPTAWRQGAPPEGVAGLMQTLREMRAREEADLAEFASTVTPENALAMLEVFEQTPRDEMTDRLFVTFLEAWGKVAGPENVSLVMDSFGKGRIGSRWRVGCDGDTNNDGAVMSFMAGWASADLAAAMDFTTRLHDEGDTWDSTMMHLGILRALENSNLEGAIAYSEQVYVDTVEFWRRQPFSGYEQKKFKGLERVLAAVQQQRGPTGLEAWVSGIDGEAPGLFAYKLEAISRVLEVLREESPERAAAWVALNAEQGYIKGFDIVSASKMFAETPQGQVEWIAALPEGADRSAMYGPFRVFLREDFDAAGQWLASQPLDPMYDKVIAHYAGESASDDPRAARLWANEITEDRLRGITLKKLEQAQ